MKTVLAIVTLSILLSACSELHAPPAANPATSAAGTSDTAPTTVAAAPEKAALSTIDDDLPPVALTRDLMFQLLAAEIAFQRGDWQSAYATTLSAAERTRDPRLAQRAFEMAWIAKQPDQALAASRIWRALAPHSEDAAQHYLNSIILDEQLNEAQTVLENGLKEAPPETRGILILQVERLLSHSRNKADSFAVLEHLLTPYADLAESHLALAYGASAKGDSQRAQSEAQAALKIKPDSEQAALTLAQVNPDKDDALKFLSKFVAAHPGAKELRIAYARILIEQKRYKEAKREFDTLLKAQPGDLTALYMLGVLEMQIGDAEAAERHLIAYLSAPTNNPTEERDPTSALLLLSQIALDRKDNDAALKWLNQVESPEAYVGVQIRRAEILAREGKVAGSLKLLADLAPSDQTQKIQVIAVNAQILRDANRVQEAMEILATGIKRFPDNTDLLYDYAMNAEKTGQLDICETALRKVIELAPKNQQAYNALGYTFAERNMRLDEAYKLIDTALKLAPDDPFIMDSMGWVQFRLGKLKEAEEVLRHAYSIKADPEIAVHLGEVLWTKGKKADAHKLWREVGSKDPGNDSLKNTLARLHVSL